MYNKDVMIMKFIPRAVLVLVLFALIFSLTASVAMGQDAGDTARLDELERRIDGLTIGIVAVAMGLALQILGLGAVLWALRRLHTTKSNKRDR